MDDIKGLLKKYKNIPEERFFNEIFKEKEYKPALYRKADVVIDVGACAGEFSAYIYKKAKVIYALEPFSEHFAELSDNVEQFGLTKIKPYRLALGDFNGEGILSVGGGRGSHKLIKGPNGDKTEPVDVKTLATFMKDEEIDRVDILKTDIENGETELYNSPDFKDVAGKIKFIIGEHSNDYVSDALRRCGFYYVDTPRGFIAKRK